MSVSITFSQIPISSLLVPGPYAELDPSGANTIGQVERGLIVGTMLSGGSATAGIPLQVSGYGDAVVKFGLGSMAAQMVADYRLQDPVGELWVLPIALPTGGSAPTATMTITGTATAYGNIFFYLAGQLISAPVSSGDTPAVIAAAVVAAAAQLSTLPATLSAAAGVITITAKDKTIAGADIDLRLNFLASAGGQSTPSGVSVAFSVANISGGVAGSTGVANPSIATGLTALGDVAFDFIVNGFGDAANIQLIASLLNDASGRWAWAKMIFGHTVSTHNGTLAASATFAEAINNQHASVFNTYGTPWPGYRCAANIAGAWAVSCRAHPALPVQNIELDIPPATVPLRYDIADRNTALTDGVATLKVEGGKTILERMVTTFTVNAAGAADNSYRDVETLDTLTWVIRDLITYLKTTYARKILVTDGTPIAGGSAMVTAKSILADIIGRYSAVYVDGAYCQDPAGFAKKARAANVGNGTVAMQLPINVANQLRVIGMQINFLKS